MTARRDQHRRELRERPYLSEHTASRHQREPRTLPELLNWFLEGFSAETPARIHGRGLWVGRPPRKVERVVDGKVAWVDAESIPADLVGGSELGAPAQAEPFRQLIENSPRQTAEDETGVEFYVRPMRAALERLAGRGDPDGDSPFMARFLVQIAYGGGDWEAVASRWKLPTFVRSTYLETALRRLHRLYRAEPPAKHYTSWLDRSDAQRAAEQAAEPVDAA